MRAPDRKGDIENARQTLFQGQREETVSDREIDKGHGAICKKHLRRRDGAFRAGDESWLRGGFVQRKPAQGCLGFLLRSRRFKIKIAHSGKGFSKARTQEGNLRRHG